MVSVGVWVCVCVLGGQTRNNDITDCVEFHDVVPCTDQSKAVKCKLLKTLVISVIYVYMPTKMRVRKFLSRCQMFKSYKVGFLITSSAVITWHFLPTWNVVLWSLFSPKVVFKKSIYFIGLVWFWFDNLLCNKYR